MAMGGKHIPVMLPEVLEGLQPKDNAIYVDGTFGGGGYTAAILESADCKVFAIDRDPEAIARGRELEKKFGPRLKLIEGCFSDMEALILAEGANKVDGIALDIGVSSFQLEDAARGFSFMRDGPLDMRMERDGESAADVVNSFFEKDLADIFYKYGEEHRSRRVAKAIVMARAENPITTTAQLSEIVSKALGGKGASKTHPATKVFQALRIYVNAELDELEAGLLAAVNLLKEGGRLVVVSFHSLEDRMVKRFFNKLSGNIPQGSRHSPPDATPGKWRGPTLILERKKALKASEMEQKLNPRARSARLRVAIRTSEVLEGV
ncbi:MAG: 16S rRNA (cytosine(1402)-N(4))-methyltransferase RsmH [Sphingomonadales bacterium]